MDNGTREGLDKFLNAASSEPETVLHYEFMQDYKVLIPCFVHSCSYFSYCLSVQKIGTFGCVMYSNIFIKFLHSEHAASVNFLFVF